MSETALADPSEQSSAWPDPLAELRTKIRARQELPPPTACRRIRERAGASQQLIADAVGVSRVSISHWESGLSSPRGDKLPRYLAALKVLEER